MSWVQDKIKEIGMQRLLQDLIDELSGDKEPYIQLLVQDLEMTLQDYLARHDDERSSM